MVFQTGIINLLNTHQTYSNILHQIGELIRENIKRNRRVIFSSIIPAYLGDYQLQDDIRKFNRMIQARVVEEGGEFLDLQGYYERNGKLSTYLFREEDGGYIHLNVDGGRAFLRQLEAILIGRNVIQSQVFRRSQSAAALV